MPLSWHRAIVLVLLVIPALALAEVQVKGFAQTGSAPGKLTIPGGLITPVESTFQEAQPSSWQQRSLVEVLTLIRHAGTL